MSSKNNYLWKPPYSSFSQLNMDAKFNKNFLLQIIKTFSKPIRKRYDGHSSEEFPIVTLFNALVGNSQRTGTQILNRKLNVLLKNTSQPSTSKDRILPHPSQMREYARKFPMEEVNQALLDISKEILALLFEKKNTIEGTIALYVEPRRGDLQTQIRLDGSENRLSFLYSNNVLDTLWHNHVVSYDGSQLELNVDDTIRQKKSLKGKVDTDNQGITRIGGHSDSRWYFNGIIDKVIILDKPYKE